VFPNSEGKAKQKYEEVSYYSVIEPTQPSFRTRNTCKIFKKTITEWYWSDQLHLKIAR